MKSEFSLIEQIRKHAILNQNPQTKIQQGIGDDCAVLPKDSKTDLVITTDLLIEDIDFRLDWTNAEILGTKCLAVSLSDVAAMGATPVWSMLSIGIPQKLWKTDYVEIFSQNYLGYARNCGVTLIGGDISRTTDKLVIDSILAGEVKKGKAILRSNAKPGDFIFVTGTLGGAAAGLKLLENGFHFERSEKIWRKNLILKQLAPLPQISIGQKIGQYQLANAMIDISDGLSSDLRHICLESQVGAKIYADKIPLHKNLRLITDSFDEKLDLALNGGEDFELLFTVSPRKVKKLKSILGKSVVWIGEITFEKTVELIKNKSIMPLIPRGFQHF
jgi:thiamine-monophosphate kinase